MATYLKTYQALSYERLQSALADLFGLTLSQGGLMNLLRRAQGRFAAGQTRAIAALRRAEVVASDETGVRIEGSNAYHWVFHSPHAVVHQAAATRGACVVCAMMWSCFEKTESTHMGMDESSSAFQAFIGSPPVDGT